MRTLSTHTRNFFRLISYTINAYTLGADILSEAEIIINRLYELMRERNLTVNRVATLAGVTQSTFSSFIYRKTVPRVDLLHSLCNALNISVRDFLDFPPYNEVEK
ncbi:helix-turn-helix transcriptional regulator [Lacticaseibacillus rhamnosus]